MTSAGVNYLAILVAAVAAFAFGAAYYGLLSKPWIRAARVDMAQARPLPPLLINSFVCELVMAWVLANLIGYFGEVSFSTGVTSAFLPGSASSRQRRPSTSDIRASAGT